MRHLYYCDGMITNWTTHWNDVAAWCADLERTGPVEIEGTGEYPLADSFWNVLLTFEVKMRFANGVRWTYRTEKPFFKVEGTEGWIYGEHKNGHIELQTHPASLLTATVGPNDRRFYLKSDKRDFIDCVKSRQQTLEPAEVGHRVTSLGLLGQIAIQTGKKLKWNPERERFVDNDAANCFLDKPVQAPTHRKKAVS
jgi:predicted dehydrogenase